MSAKEVTVDAERFAAFVAAYSGQTLTKNRCKSVIFEHRLWTVTELSYMRGETTATLHELVAPERYHGKTGSYPTKNSRVFYKGQVVRARGEPYVMSGRRITVRKSAVGPAVQGELFGSLDAGTTPERR